MVNECIDSLSSVLNGSYNDAKKNIILCKAMCLHGLRFKNTLFSTYRPLLLLLSTLSFGNVPIFTKLSLCNFTAFIYARTACNTPKTKNNLKSHIKSIKFVTMSAL